MSYATPERVYGLGLPPEAFARPVRLVEGLVPISGTFQLRAHGLSAGAELTLAVLSDSTLGATPAGLPSGLSEGVTYYAIPGGSNTFQIANVAGGRAIIPADEGTGVYGVLVDYLPDLLQACVDADAIVDAHLASHRGPVVSPAVPGIASRLAARIYVGAHGLGNPIYAAVFEGISSMRIMDEKLMAGWYAGRPLPAGSTDASPGVAENGAVLVTLASRRFLDDVEENGV